MIATHAKEAADQKCIGRLFFIENEANEDAFQLDKKRN
jgi:hypothetical protein